MPGRPGTISVPGAQLHVVEYGNPAGRPAVLVPGWPQSGYAWRRVAPQLGDRRIVVLDPRGLGETTVESDAFAVESASADLLALLDELSLDEPVDVVAHDVGTWISHAAVAVRPERVRSLVLVDAGIPGVTSLPSGIPDEAGNTRSWHFGFNRLRGLPELLISGREREYLAWLFTSKSVHPEVFDDDALDEYARILAQPGAVAAGMEYYRRIFSADGLAAARLRGESRLPMPVLAIGGSGGVGSTLYEALRTRGDRVEGLVFDDCGHYVPEERPDDLAIAIRDFWTRTKE